MGGGFGGLRAAPNLKSDLVDVTLVDRRNYHLFQPLAVIGPAAAVANVFGTNLSGIAACLVWFFIHLMYLVTFDSRLQVTGLAPTDFNFIHELARLRGSGNVKPETVTPYPASSS